MPLFVRMLPAALARLSSPLLAGAASVALLLAPMRTASAQGADARGGPRGVRDRRADGLRREIRRLQRRNRANGSHRRRHAPRAQGVAHQAGDRRRNPRLSRARHPRKLDRRRDLQLAPPSPGDGRRASRAHEGLRDHARARRVQGRRQAGAPDRGAAARRGGVHLLRAQPAARGGEDATTFPATSSPTAIRSRSSSTGGRR